jgi:hypothetical protein
MNASSAPLTWSISAPKAVNIIGPGRWPTICTADGKAGKRVAISAIVAGSTRISSTIQTKAPMAAASASAKSARRRVPAARSPITTATQTTASVGTARPRLRYAQTERL